MDWLATALRFSFSELDTRPSLPKEDEETREAYYAGKSPSRARSVRPSGVDITRAPVNRDALLKHRLFYNVTDTTSIFICGSQGSGKSHTWVQLYSEGLFDLLRGGLSAARRP